MLAGSGARTCARPVMRGEMTLHILHTLHNTEGAPKPDDDSLTLDDQPQPDPILPVWFTTRRMSDHWVFGLLMRTGPSWPNYPRGRKGRPARQSRRREEAAIQMPPSRPKKPAPGPQDGFGAPPDVQRAASDRPRELTQP
jgi:hypothetical protein